MHGDGNIILPTWSEVDGQDDIQWYATKTEVVSTGGFHYWYAKHTGAGFSTHVYRNLNGKMIGLTGTEGYQVRETCYPNNYAAATTYQKVNALEI